MAGRAFPFPDIKRELFIPGHDIPADTARLSGVFGRHKDDSAPIQFGFVLQHGQESPPPGVADCPRKFMVTHQVPYLQILGSNEILALDFMLRVRMEVIRPLAVSYTHLKDLPF